MLVTYLSIPRDLSIYVEHLSSVIYHSNYYFAEAPRISIPSVPASYKEGSSVNIGCTASGTPDPDVQWFRNGIMKRSGIKTTFLTFISINRTDAGRYTCRANNSAGNDQNQVTLVVHCKLNFVFMSLYISLQMTTEELRLY